MSNLPDCWLRNSALPVSYIPCPAYAVIDSYRRLRAERLGSVLLTKSQEVCRSNLYDPITRVPRLISLRNQAMFTVRVFDFPAADVG